MLDATTCSCSRRAFMAGSIGCGAYVALSLAGAAGLARRAFAAIPAGETILTRSVHDWHKATRPALAKRPTLFLLLA